jgi:hypothetical protein
MADTPEELSMLTIAAQTNWGMTLDFFDFSQLKNGKFICWFKVPLMEWSERVANG